MVQFYLHFEREKHPHVFENANIVALLLCLSIVCSSSSTSSSDHVIPCIRLFLCLFGLVFSILHSASFNMQVSNGKKRGLQDKLAILFLYILD